MEGVEESRVPRSEANNVRPASRPGSVPRDTPHLSRMTSGNHIDDASHYHHHRNSETFLADHPDEDGTSTSGGSELTEKTSNDTAGSGDTEEVAEIRMGIPDVRDLEQGKLEKTKSRRSTRSARDPNLVGWDGPDDPVSFIVPDLNDEVLCCVRLKQ